ncbi:MAG: gliding motility-associated C-terminal domain-containing protein [Ignavibacteriae bacterium]|nr:MAG: gliding motility-associated C-terminal domain-containing protein [Ignavibacteriota bacterium]
MFDADSKPDAMIEELDESNLLRWTVTNGVCPAVSDSMNVTIHPLEIVKGFTPNGDSKNDYFDLGATYAENIHIKIFSKTGTLVHESENYEAGSLWDGYNKTGVELPEGTYFYIADIKVAGRQKRVQFRSFVEILR